MFSDDDAIYKQWYKTIIIITITIQGSNVFVGTEWQFILLVLQGSLSIPSITYAAIVSVCATNAC